jgi:putative toxin-antitoxin system antitoxin component (TIGR02293 family)
MGMSFAPRPDAEIGGMRALLDISREQFGRMIEVSAKTVERWEAKRARRAQVTSGATRLSELAEIIELGRTVYSDDGLREFLRTPMAAFGNRTPTQMIQAGEAARVIAILAADYEGLGF